MLPWCGTVPMYYNLSILSRKIKCGEVIINNEARLQIVISNGQTFTINGDTGKSGFYRIIVEGKNKLIFAVATSYGPAFYFENFSPGKNLELKNSVYFPEQVYPDKGWQINDSLFVFTYYRQNSSKGLFKLSGSNFSKLDTLGNYNILTYKNNKLFYLVENFLYSRRFNTALNQFDNAKKLLQTGSIRTLSSDENDFATLKNDSLLIYSFNKDSIIYKSRYLNFSNIKNIHIDSPNVYLELYDHSVGVSDKSAIPATYSLLQNYPNPFNPSTTINYSIASAGNVTLKIYDMLGREVATLVNEYKQPGNYRVNFSVKTLHPAAAGQVAASLSTGVYFYTMQCGSFKDTKKLILLK